LLRVFRLLILLLVACPVVMATAVFDTPPSLQHRALLGIGATSLSDETPQLTRLGNEIDDLREALPGPTPRFGVVSQMLAAFAPRHTNWLEARREPPPDRPPRPIG